MGFLIKNPDSKKNLSEEDKDMIVNEISLVIQKTPECWNLILVEFTSFGEVLSRGELFLSNPRATSPGRTKHKQIAAKCTLRRAPGLEGVSVPWLVLASCPM